MAPIRWVVVASLAAMIACRPSTETSSEPADLASTPATVQQVIVAGRVVRDGAALPGVQVGYGFGFGEDAVVSDEAGEFRLVVAEEFARAPVIHLGLSTADHHRFGAVLRNLGQPLIRASFDVSGPLRVDLRDRTAEQQAWLDVHSWAEREASEWLNAADHAAQLAQWARIAEAIVAEPDELRRGLMTAAQFQIGRSQPESGLDRSAIARAALDELGLDDPRWAMYPWLVLAAVHESGRWHELAPRLDALISEHPQPEVAAYIALERYGQSSAEGPAGEAAAIWQRWLDRPALARTGFAAIMLSIGPKRPLAAGQPLPELCVEDLDSGSLCLADLRGRMVVLEIWAIGCKGCQKATADLRAAHAALTGDDAPLFVSISAWNDSEPLAAFLRDEPMPWRHGWVREEQRDAFQSTLGFTGVPTMVLIDADGTILASSPELRPESVLEQIEALRRGP